MSPPEKPATIQISHLNKGYEILRETGWSQQSGLGIEEQGRLYPVPARMKIDRSGLGAGGITRSVLSQPSQSSQPTTNRRRTRKEIDADAKQERHDREKMIRYMHSRD